MLPLLTMATKKPKKEAMGLVGVRVPMSVLQRLEKRAAEMSRKTRINVTVGALVRSILEEHA